MFCDRNTFLVLGPSGPSWARVLQRQDPVIATTEKAVTVTKRTMAKLAATGGLAIAAAATLVPTASASGTSGTTNGCYSTWGSTGSNAHCTNPYVTYPGNFRNHGLCFLEGDQTSSWRWFNQFDWNPGWGQVDCTFQINESFVDWD